MVLEEESGLLLAHQPLSFSLGEGGHLIEYVSLGADAVLVEGDRAAIDDEVGHLFGDPPGALHLPVLQRARAGAEGGLLDGGEPLQRHLARRRRHVEGRAHLRALDAHQPASGAALLAHY